MFHLRLWIAGLIALATALTLGVAAYWNKAKPMYAFLVFGPEAKIRIRVVQDGEKLYVDRNGDGDSSGKNERFTLKFAIQDTNGFGSVKDCNIEIRDADEKTRYVITSFTIFSDKESAGRHLTANVDIKGPVSYRQYCDAKLDEKSEQGSIAHFHGPLTIGPRTINWKLPPEFSRFTVGDPPREINAVVGTMDAERGCWVAVRSEDLPKDLHPVVTVEYPAKKAGDTPIKQRYRLEQRC